MLAPHGRDAAIAVAMLREANVEASPCIDLVDLVSDVESGAAFVVITEEAIASGVKAAFKVDWQLRRMG